MINTGHALSVLETVYPNQGELHQVVTKLLDVAREQAEPAKIEPLE